LREVSAALRTIMRRDYSETYREMLTRIAKESGVETQTTNDLIRLDRKRKGKKLSKTGGARPIRTRRSPR
jgi:transposase